MPAQGPYILAVNHLHYFDPPLAYASLPRSITPQTRALAAEKYRYKPVGIPAYLTNSIFVKRGEVDRAALRKCLAHLKQGGILGIAPEGTRSKTGGLQRGKSGIIYLAQHAGVPIVPIAAYGQERAWQELKRGRRQRVVVRIGEPFTLPAIDRKRKSEQLEELTTELMCRIAALLPEEYHGVYQRHVCESNE